MRRILLFLLLAPCALLRAYDVEVDGIYYNLIGTTMAYVTHGGSFGGIEPNSYSGDVVVPEQISYKGNTYRVYTIGNNAFACCDELTSVRLPSTVHGIGFCAFLGSDKLRQVYLPDDFRVVNSCAFTGCTSLQQFSFPRKAELVDSLTFYCCASLTSMVLPHRIRTICQGALEHLPSIRHLYCYASEPPKVEKGAFTLADQRKCTLHVPRESLDSYKKAPIWSDFSEIVPLSDAEYVERNYRRGDINDDGLIDDKDLALLRLIIVSLPDDSAVRWAADINEDGVVNAKDFVLLAKKLAS